jgi:lipopolysaccharide exporter
MTSDRGSATSGAWGQSVRRGVFWSNATFVASKILNFVALIVLARILVPSQFGVVAAISTFVSFLQLGATLGMRATVVYEQEHGITPRVQTAFTVNLVMVVAFTAVGELLAPVVAAFFGASHHVALFQLGVLSLFIAGLGNVQDGLLLRELRFNVRIIPELARGVTSGVVSIVLALAGLGALSLVLGLLAGSAAWTAGQWVLAGFRPTFSLDRQIARSMVVYGLGASMLEVVAVVSQRTDSAVIAHVLGDRALGIYTIGGRLPELIISNIAWNVSIVAFPALARRRATESDAGLAAGSLQLLRYQALYALPVAVGLAVLAPAVVVTLFSVRWAQAGGVTSAEALAAGISATIFPLGDVFKATGRQWVLIFLNLLLLPLLIVAMIAAAPGGLLVVAWVRAGISALFVALFLAAVRRELKVRMREILAAVRPAVTAAGGVAAGAGAVRLALPTAGVSLLVLGAIVGGVVGLVALRTLDSATFDDVLRMLPRSVRPRRYRPVR